MLFIQVFLLCTCAMVKTQEIVESSGDVSTISIVDLTADPASSGEGAILTELVRVFGDQNATDDALTNGNDSSIFSIGEIDPDSGMDGNYTTTELTATDANESTTTTTQQPSTTTIAATNEVTTTLPTTTTSLRPTTSATTTIADPTTEQTTTTTVPTTTQRTTTHTTTTLRPRTTTTKLTTRRSKETTILLPRESISTTAEPSEVPCEFLENDFVCDVEISCFGEGVVDCNYVEEPLQEIPEPTNGPHSSESDYYEEEESATVGFFPPELVGRAPPNNRFPHLWRMKPTVEEENSTSTTLPAGDHNSIADTTTLAARTTTEPPTEPQETTRIIEQVQTTSTVPEAVSENVSVPVRTQSTTPDSRLNDSEEVSESSMTDFEVFEMNVTDNETQQGGNSTEGDIAVPVEISSSSNVASTAPAPTLVKKRRKREEMKPRSEPSASESLQLALEGAKKRTNSCKITGNLHCNPMPNTAFCRGRGTCQVISIEKKEKSTSVKGVESWAIAVIVICATAAILTIGLLGYLVVTSWKKLKVQPQNGVTTLTYVNNTPP